MLLTPSGEKPEVLEDMHDTQGSPQGQKLFDPKMSGVP
jgi:hypothetical protein